MMNKNCSVIHYKCIKRAILTGLPKMILLHILNNQLLKNIRKQVMMVNRENVYL